MRLIKHALLMVKKNIKNYAFLSITAILSFTILFVYFMYSDSEMYNRYKEVDGCDSKIILSEEIYNSENVRILSKQLDELKNTKYYYMGNCLGRSSLGHQNCDIEVTPSYIWGMFENSDIDENTEFVFPKRLTIDGKNEVKINSDEAIVSKAVYDYLEKNNLEKKVTITFYGKDDEEFSKEYKIIGKYTNPSGKYSNPKKCSEGDKIYISDSYISRKCDLVNMTFVINTDHQSAVLSMLDDLGMAQTGAYIYKSDEAEEKALNTKTKYIISIVLFILLGINMYSSFLNALNDRKFEIGVKRALGAGKISIMLQFMIEGTIVMLTNIIISIMIGIDSMLVYKMYMTHKYGATYVLIMSRESIILYLIFSLFLSVVFSLIFSYKSTRVEIIKYLKEEG